MEAHAPTLRSPAKPAAAKAPVAAKARTEREPATPQATSGWRVPAPLPWVVVAMVLGAVTFLLAATWVAVVASNPEAKGDAALPWAIGCASLGFSAFAAAVAASLIPRVRNALLAATLFAFVLLATTVLAMRMSLPSERIEASAAPGQDTLFDERGN
jgi:hypothetical protein